MSHANPMNFFKPREEVCECCQERQRKCQDYSKVGGRMRYAREELLKFKNWMQKSEIVWTGESPSEDEIMTVMAQLVADYMHDGACGFDELE